MILLYVGLWLLMIILTLVTYIVKANRLKTKLKNYGKEIKKGASKKTEEGYDHSGASEKS